MSTDLHAAEAARCRVLARFIIEHLADEGRLANSADESTWLCRSGRLLQWAYQLEVLEVSPAGTPARVPAESRRFRSVPVAPTVAQANQSVPAAPQESPLTC